MKKRRINKRILYIILSIIIISVFTLTIAYAVLSTSLNITGSAEISGSSWGLTISEVDITNVLPEYMTNYYSNNGAKIQGNEIVFGDAQIIKKPTIIETSSTDGSYSLTKPGDGVFLSYVLTNNGSIPAKLDLADYIEPNITSSTNNTVDIEWVNENLSGGILIFKSIMDDDYFTEGNILCPGNSIHLLIILGINENATSVPSSTLTIENIGMILNFVQADQNEC